MAKKSAKKEAKKKAKKSAARKPRPAKVTTPPVAPQISAGLEQQQSNATEIQAQESEAPVVSKRDEKNALRKELQSKLKAEKNARKRTALRREYAKKLKY